MLARHECRRCGACCVNTPENRCEGFAAYVEVKPDDALLHRPELRRRFVVVDKEGGTHMRLDAQARCAALRGALGRRVGCAIYHYRPSPCRRVQAGSDLCQRYRAAAGLAPL